MNYYQEALEDCSHNLLTKNVFDNLLIKFDTTRISNFTDIVLHIVNEKINFMSEDLKVVYNRNHIKHFRTLPWWFKSSIFVDYNLQNSSNGTIERESEVNNTRNFSMTSLQMDVEDNEDDVIMVDDYINEILNTSEAFTSVAEFCNSARERMMDMRRTAEKFETQLEEQRMKSQRLEEEIQNALLEETI